MVGTGASELQEHFTTLEVAKMLGMAVRSVQMMVDRGELSAWKTPGGHRRISRQSVQRWLDKRPNGGLAERPPTSIENSGARGKGPRILVIEDSAHYQNLLALLLQQHFPDATVQVADDGIAGLAMAGRLDPDVLIIDILLPGIDGATLITSLRSHEQFRHCRLVVVTALDEVQRAPYEFALGGVPVIHKSQLVAEPPPLLALILDNTATART